MYFELSTGGLEFVCRWPCPSSPTLLGLALASLAHAVLAALLLAHASLPHPPGFTVMHVKQSSQLYRRAILNCDLVLAEGHDNS